ncbi:RES family NAD+ phosphorylase [Lysobacter sp.]|uniref:RES family NAD+ phosphorylase n=1 Tax=Lysobacter sp. TaxID=72226 RepID=UPI002D6C5EEF|nr:RES family NAD+ phosphorylase [Lysobacter sp.]HZX77731.1 RES family NAD+ phosphorylase [Lysobacter sp.]
MTIAHDRQPDAAVGANDDARAETRNDAKAIALFRIVAASNADRAFSEANGDKAGRWSSASTPVIYASLSAACALLEFLAHLEGPPEEALRLVEARMPADALREVGALPHDWSQHPYRPHVQAIGDEWVRAGSSLALRVPSALSPRECNVLINATHADLHLLETVGHEHIQLDPRLHE